MMRRRSGYPVLMMLVLLSLALPVWAQEESVEAGSGESDAAAEEGVPGETENETGRRTVTPGFIFNARNLLLDLSSYQGGVGGKFDFGEFALRALFSFTLENAQTETSRNDIDLTVGVAAEFPFFDGRVSPYWGGFIDGTVASEKAENAAGEESSLLVLRGSAGPILGAELYIFDFLSVFAEYLLSFSVARTRSKSEATDTDTQTTNYELATSLGNGGSLGVVIYLNHKPFDETGEDTDSAETAR